MEFARLDVKPYLKALQWQSPESKRLSKAFQALSGSIAITSFYEVEATNFFPLQKVAMIQTPMAGAFIDWTR